MKVFIVILNYNGQDFILQCLDSVERLNSKGLEIRTLVVDNASKDNSVELIKTKHEEMEVLINEKNLGFAKGNNIGIKSALEKGADYILILNPDTIVDKDLVVQLIKSVESDHGIGVVGPKIYFVPGYEFHSARYKPNERGKVIWYAGGLIDWKNILASHRGVDEVDGGQYDKTVETDFVSGCGMLVKREVFEKIGLLDERYFLYWEDNDFCQRAKKAGFKLIYEPSAKMFHLNAGSSSSGGPLQEYYLTRNRLLFGGSYASIRTKLALFRESLRLLISGRQWQKIGVRDFYLKRFGKGSWR